LRPERIVARNSIISDFGVNQILIVGILVKNDVSCICGKIACSKGNVDKEKRKKGCASGEIGV
jgi:hypothetical protein